MNDNPKLNETSRPVSPFPHATAQEENGAPVATAVSDDMRRAQFIVDRARDAVFWINSSGRLVYVNHAACRTLGYTKDELESMTVFDIDPLLKRELWTDHWNKTREMKSYLFETQHKTRDGRTLPVEISVDFLVFGNQEYHSSFARDITERKQAESALREKEFFLSRSQEVARIGSYNLNVASGLWMCTPALDAIFGIDERFPKTVDGWLSLIFPDDRATMRDHLLTTVLAERKRFEHEYRIIRQSDGKVRWVSGLGELELDEKGSPVRMFGTIQDITERKQAEEAVRASEERYRQLFNMESNALVLVDQLTGRVMQVNDAAVSLYGYSRAEWLAMKNTDVSAEPDKTREATVLQTANIPVRWHHKRDGTVFPVEIFPSFFEIAGRPVHLAAIRDISERFKAQERILQLNRVYAVLSNINQAIIRIRVKDELFEEICRIAVRDGNFSCAWIGRVDNHTGSVHLHAGQGIPAPHLQRLATSLDQEYQRDSHAAASLRKGARAVCNDIQRSETASALKAFAREHSFRSYASFPVSFPGHSMGVFTLYSSQTDFFNDEEIRLLDELAADISYAMEFFEQEDQRIRAEAALKESEGKYRLVLEHIDEIIYIIPGGNPDKFDGSFQVMSGAIEKILGYPPEAFVSDPSLWSEAIHPDDITPVVETTRRIYATGKPETRMYRLRNLKTGSYHCVEDHVVPQLNGDGKVISVFGVARDITERKKAEGELRKLSLAVEQSPVSVMITNVRGDIEYVNPKFSELTGYSFDEARGKNPRLIQSGIMPRELYKEMWDTIMKGEVWHGEMQNKRRHGEVYWANLTISPIREAGGTITHFVGIQEDITKRRELEEQLRQAQKLESLGTLAGGIAHDFNNILSIILGHASLLSTQRQKPAQAEDRIRAIITAVERGTGVVRQMLTFARKTDLKLEQVDVNNEIGDIVKLLSETFPRMVEIQTQIQPHLPSVVADKNQFHQVLLNLCVNSRDAILEHSRTGTISLSTSLKSAQMLSQRFPEAVEGHYIEITVADNGCGIEEAAREHIFEPFFTTKEKGKGTGLGLAVVYGVIKSLHGFLDLESSPGAGTTFRLYLPAARRTTKGLPATEAADADVPGGDETILLVEDEESLRELLAGFLRDKGFSVITASDGTEAVNLFQAHHEKIDLVLTDIGLPKMSGLDVVRHVMKINPRVKTVVASGYLEPEEKENLAGKGIREFIGKPYLPSLVISTIRRVLDDK